jgi:hypothetical protein
VLRLGASRTARSRIASAAAVYNEILARDPSALEVLYAPMYWDRNDEHAPGEDPYFALPVLSDVNGRPRFFYIGWYIRDAQRHAEVPRLTGEQLAAMRLIEDIANDPAFHVEMDFQPGDIQLLNNARHPPRPRCLRGRPPPDPTAAPAAALALRARLHRRRGHLRAGIPVRDD